MTGDGSPVPQEESRVGGKKRVKKPREFDFEKYPQRHIVLKVAYHGHAHDGLAKQENTANTVEQIVCEVMKKVRLVPQSGPLKFSRCGRTDKGVSALGNALSMMLRASDDDAKPLDYCKMINNALPDTIRIVAWSFVDDTFDARFSCRSRTYRYFFPSSGLDLGAMQEAASYLVGTHDYRNFCKMDVVNVSTFVRNILYAEIKPASTSPGSKLHFLEIRGNAFLYHQIRCTMTVLLMVGMGQEQASVVKTLLDVKEISAKPCYPLASEIPLVLWDCSYDQGAVHWQASVDTFHEILQEMEALADAMAVRSSIASEMKAQLVQWFPVTSAAVPTDRSRPHLKLLQRPRELTFEERVDGLRGAKRKRREENLLKGAEREMESGN